MRTDNNGEQQWEPYASSILWAFIRSPRLGTSRNTVCGSCAAAGTIFMGLLAIFERPEDGYKLWESSACSISWVCYSESQIGALEGPPFAELVRPPVRFHGTAGHFLKDWKMVTNSANHRLVRFHGSVIRSPKLGPSRPQPCEVGHTKMHKNTIRQVTVAIPTKRGRMHRNA